MIDNTANYENTIGQILDGASLDVFGKVFADLDEAQQQMVTTEFGAIYIETINKQLLN